MFTLPGRTSGEYPNVRLGITQTYIRVIAFINDNIFSIACSSLFNTTIRNISFHGTITLLHDTSFKYLPHGKVL